MSALIYSFAQPASDSYAANCAGSRYSCNDAEQQARAECAASPGIRRGSIWFSTSSGVDGTNDPETGYYAQGVYVEGDATTVSVKIRGSVWPCGSGRYGRVYAYNIRDGRSGSSRKLTVSGGRHLYRGNITSGSAWSSRGGSVSGVLNVDGIAPLNGGTSATQNIIVPVYRCFTVSDTGSPSCYSTDISVKVTREAEDEPNNVTLSKQTARMISSGSLTGYDTIPSTLAWASPWVVADGEATAGQDYLFFLNRVRSSGAASSNYTFQRARQRSIEKIDNDAYSFSAQGFCPSGWSAYVDSCVSGNTMPATTTWDSVPKYGFYPANQNALKRSWSTTTNSANQDVPAKISQLRAGTTLCERYGTNPRRVTDPATPGWHWGSWRCVDVKYWSLNVETYISIDGSSWHDSNKSPTRPGNNVRFKHEISNAGTQNTISNIGGRIYSGHTTSGSWSAYANVGSVPADGMVTKNSPDYRVVASDAGRDICSKYAINQSTNKYVVNSLTAGRGYLESWGDVESDGGVGSVICTHVPYNYNLTPKINATAAGLEAGTVVDPSFINVSVYAETTNAGNAATNSKPNVGYKLEYYIQGSSNMTQLAEGVTSGGIAPGSYTPSSSVGSSFQLPDVLDKDVCFVFTIGNVGRGSSFATVTDDGDTTPSKSAESCVRLGKKPKVAITGGDVIVGRNTPGSNVYGSSTTYPSEATQGPRKTATTGSWSEYAIFASGVVDSFGSAGGFANRRDTSSGSTLTNLKVGIGGLVDVCQYGVMTFTDVGLRPSGSANPNDVECPGNGGNYEVKSAARPISTMLRPTTVNMSAWDPNSTGITSRLYTGNQTFSANNVKGTVILAVNGNVTINGNITLDDNTLKAAYASGNFAAIPQVVIIASGNITINSDVTRVDAWLITDGANSEVQTCNLLGRSLSECNQQLIVNGPVATNTLRLRRTAGADISSNTDWGSRPAEIFNLRADAYLWARGYGESLTSPVRTTFVEELPPRL